MVLEFVCHQISTFSVSSSILSLCDELGNDLWVSLGFPEGSYECLHDYILLADEAWILWQVVAGSDVGSECYAVFQTRTIHLDFLHVSMIIVILIYFHIPLIKKIFHKLKVKSCLLETCLFHIFIVIHYWDL